MPTQAEINADRRDALLWASWIELNAIRARDGIPWTSQGHRSGVSETYFSALVDALSDELGDDAKPWPSERMKPHIAAFTGASDD